MKDSRRSHRALGQDSQCVLFSPFRGKLFIFLPDDSAREESSSQIKGHTQSANSCADGSVKISAHLTHHPWWATTMLREVICHWTQVCLLVLAGRAKRARSWPPRYLRHFPGLGFQCASLRYEIIPSSGYEVFQLSVPQLWCKLTAPGEHHQWWFFGSWYSSHCKV